MPARCSPTPATMPDARTRLLRENNPDFASFVLGGTHIRDVPAPDSLYPDRVIVSLPWSYNEQPERTYPVVYLCDGYWDFPLVWGLYSHLLYDKVVPEYILVGLGYGGDKPDVDTLRKADLAPPASPADDYLRRIKESLIPFVEAEYACDGSFRVIAGVSIGGAFALSALFRAPGLFQGAIALSPTVESFDRWIFRLEEEYQQAGSTLATKLLGKRRELAARLFLAAGGADDARIVNGIEGFDRLLDSRGYRFFDKKYCRIEGEKHAGLKAEGMNRGLRHVFAGTAAAG